MHTAIRTLGLLVLALCAALSARAQLTVESSVFALAGMFRYSYQVHNATPVDVSVVTLSGLWSAPDSVQNLSAPSEFLAVYDSGLSLVSFLEGAQPFLAGTWSGPFTFDSPYAPGRGAFEALDVNGGFLTGAVDVPASPVPEPATTAAFGAALLVGLVLRRKLVASTK